MREQLRLPLVAALFAFLAGALLGMRVGAVSPAVSALALPLLLGGALHGRVSGCPLGTSARERVLLLALACAGAGDGALARRSAALDCRAQLDDGTPLLLRGALAADFAPPEDSTERIPLLPLVVQDATGAGGRVPRCDVEARVRLPRGTPALAAGSELRLLGEWRLMPAPVERSRWPEAPAYRGYLLVRRATPRRPAVFPPPPAAQPARQQRAPAAAAAAAQRGAGRGAGAGAARDARPRPH